MLSQRGCARIASRKAAVSSSGSISPRPIARPRSPAPICRHSAMRASAASGKTVAAGDRMDNPGRAGIAEVVRDDADVIVTGGGLSGPALALALARAGLTVTVIDAQPATARAEAGFDGRAYALALASKRRREAVVVWDRVAANAQPILEIKTSDGRPGEGPSRFFLHFDAADTDAGPLALMV